MSADRVAAMAVLHSSESPQATHFVELLEARGLAIVPLPVPSSARAAEALARTGSVAPKAWVLFSEFFRCVRLLRSRPVETIFCFAGGSLSLLALALAKLTHARLVIYFTGSDIHLLGGVRGWIAIRVYRRADELLANGQDLALQAARALPGLTVRSWLHGVPAPPAEVPAVGPPGTILVTRYLRPIYEHEVVIEAVRLLVANGRDVRLTLAGSGPLQGELELLAENAGLRHHVQFLGGYGRSAFPALAANHRIYVSMCRTDGTSTSLLEAMLFGLYPVVADSPANREWLGEGLGRGTLVAPGRADALASALEEVLARSEDDLRTCATWNLEFVGPLADAEAGVEDLVRRMGGR